MAIDIIARGISNKNKQDIATHALQITEILQLQKGIEVLDNDPTELWNGRMWLVTEPIYTETIGIDLLEQAGNANYGGLSNVAELMYKVSLSYKPSADVYLTKAEFKLSSRQTTYHDTGNDIRVRLCSDNGTGKPNESNVLATTTITGCPATTDTLFTGVATFATSTNNFTGKILLTAGVRYHLVLDIPSVTGKSFYSTRAVTGSSSTDGFALTKYGTGVWENIEETVNPNYKLWKAV